MVHIHLCALACTAVAVAPLRQLCIIFPAALRALKAAVVGGPFDLLNQVQSFNSSLDPCHQDDQSCSSCLVDAAGCGQLRPEASPGEPGAYFCNFFGIACTNGR